MDQPNSIDVVYLSWLPYGMEYFTRFLNSYNKFEAAAAHRLVIAINGSKDSSVNKAYEEVLQQQQIHSYTLLNFASGQDIEIYRRIAVQSTADALLFLNTYSQILANHWLLKYKSNLNQTVGLIGASGNYANYFTAIRTNFYQQVQQGKHWKKVFNEWKYFVKIWWKYRHQFSSFPSPHIRTNAFFIHRLLFVEICPEKVPTKMDAYFFENGKHNMTVQVTSKGFEARIIDKNGATYPAENWKMSQTFWQANQENLMIADNQTAVYENADTEERILKQHSVWGK